MLQVSIFGLKQSLTPVRQSLSDAIHRAVMQCLAYPSAKRFHRFIMMEREDFMFPADRTDRYTIIEIKLFEGRAPAVKKRLLTALYDEILTRTGIMPEDVEIILIETARQDWGIKGQPGDEVGQSYRVEL